MEQRLLEQRLMEPWLLEQWLMEQRLMEQRLMETAVDGTAPTRLFLPLYVCVLQSNMGSPLRNTMHGMQWLCCVTFCKVGVDVHTRFPEVSMPHWSFICQVEGMSNNRVCFPRVWSSASCVVQESVLCMRHCRADLVLFD